MSLFSVQISIPKLYVFTFVYRLHKIKYEHDLAILSNQKHVDL